MITTWATEPDPADGARSGARGLHEDQAARGTFDSLLRSLLSWELVSHAADGETDGDRGAGGDGEWRLSEIAQRRLSAIQPVVPRLDEHTVYFGHACVDCRQRRPTRLTDGVYRCESCAERRRMATEIGTPAGIDARAAARRGQSRGGLWERRLQRRHTGTGATIDDAGDQRSSA